MLVPDSAADELVIDRLCEAGFDVQVESKSESTYSRLLASPPDLLIIDLTDSYDGIELIKKVRASGKLQRTLIMVIAEWGTGQPTLALSIGADAFERKPVDASRILASAEKLLRAGFVKTASAAKLLRIDAPKPATRK